MSALGSDHWFRAQTIPCPVVNYCSLWQSLSQTTLLSAFISFNILVDILIKYIIYYIFVCFCPLVLMAANKADATNSTLGYHQPLIYTENTHSQYWFIYTLCLFR